MPKYRIKFNSIKASKIINGDYIKYSDSSRDVFYFEISKKVSLFFYGPAN